MAPTGRARILQLHPSRRCNLRCLHCYSASSPEEHDQLDSELLQAAIADAAAEGYTVVSCSGGEPLLYKPLRTLLDQAHQCGMTTALTTNGMLLDERRLEQLHGAIDLIAISLDGIPASHNRMRASERAFEQMVARLEGLRSSAIPFGFIFTLTQYNLNELEWVARFAIEQGARLLQIHPLEETGRAFATLRGGRPDAVEAAFAYLEVLRVQALAQGKLHVQLDLADRELLRSQPDKVFAAELAAQAQEAPLAELLSPLIIEADGMVVPIQYGFARAYALGNLRDGDLRSHAARWRREQLPGFRALCRKVYDETTSAQGLPFFNWYEAIARTAASA